MIIEIDVDEIIMNLARHYGVEYAFDGNHKLYKNDKNNKLYCKNINNTKKHFEISNQDIDIINALICLIRNKPLVETEILQ